MMLLFHFCCRLAEEEDQMQWHIHIYAKSNAQLSIVWYHPVDNAWLITTITFWERFVVVHIFCWFIVFFFFWWRISIFISFSRLCIVDYYDHILLSKGEACRVLFLIHRPWWNGWRWFVVLFLDTLLFWLCCSCFPLWWMPFFFRFAVVVFAFIFLSSFCFCSCFGGLHSFIFLLPLTLVQLPIAANAWHHLYLWNTCQWLKNHTYILWGHQFTHLLIFSLQIIMLLYIFHFYTAKSMVFSP